MNKIIVQLLSVAFLAAILLPICAGAQDTSTPEPITALVRSGFHHGLPYSLARNHYGPEAVPELIAMLESDDERDHWPNIVWTLGVLGDPRATQPLISFLEHRFVGEVETSVWRALVIVPQSLGLLAGASDIDAYNYLEAGITPGTWRGDKLRWSFPTLADGDREVLMAKLAINGVGLSGKPKGRLKLAELKLSLPRQDRKIWRYLRPNVTEAIERSERVERLGYEEFFSESSGPR